MNLPNPFAKNDPAPTPTAEVTPSPTVVEDNLVTKEYPFSKAQKQNIRITHPQDMTVSNTCPVNSNCVTTLTINDQQLVLSGSSGVGALQRLTSNGRTVISTFKHRNGTTIYLVKAATNYADSSGKTDLYQYITLVKDKECKPAEYDPQLSPPCTYVHFGVLGINGVATFSLPKTLTE